MSVSSENSLFWNELCGTQLAKHLGISDRSRDSLRKFDDWYFDFYPYLSKHIPFSDLGGSDVLEVGLGYGTVAQRIAASGANYTGLDIAKGPVDMVNHRLAQTGVRGEAIQGSILEPPFSHESFDTIVAIGCLHHTGNLKKAIESCWALLRPGGRLIFMVYYAYSYRRFRMAPWITLRYALNESKGYRGVVGRSQESDRAAYDVSSDGIGAPHTDWISVRSLKELCGKFTSFKGTIENIDREMPFTMFSRDSLLKTRIPSFAGLDLYATAIK